MTPSWTDPIVDEIRKVREEYAAKFDYDLDKIFADVKKREKASGRKYVSYPPKPAIKRPAKQQES